MRRNHTLLGILTTAALCSTMLPLSASAGEKFQLNGGGQRKGVSDGYSYELWIDNTGGNGSMTLGNGGTFEAVWNCSVPQGNYLARRGMDFAKDNKNALSYGNIQMDYEASYKASSAGNSRLCVYGWFAENTAPQVSGTVVEYYIIEDWVNWCPKPDGQSKTVKIDGADYEIFRIKHTGPTIRNGGGSETFWQYFSIRKSKRTSGTISVSEHFQAWKDAGFEIYNLYEVALNAEGWESSGSANVTKLEMSVGGDPKPTEAPKPTEPPTEPKDGIYMKEDFASGAGDWTARGSGGVKVTPSDGALNVTGRSDNWHGAAIALDSTKYIPGNAYSFSVMGKAASADTLKLTLQYNAGGTENYDSVAEITAPAGQWVQLANDSFTIPAGASDMILYVEAESKSNDFSIDDATIATKGTKIAASGSGKTDPTQPASESGSTVRGDVNSDGKCNIMDIIALQKYLLGLKTTVNGANADMNADGVIDIFDLALLKRQVIFTGGGGTNPQPTNPQPTQAPTQEATKANYSGSYMSSIQVTGNVPQGANGKQAGVQYGKMENITYQSTIANKQKKAIVQLPPNYDPSKKYPVLYVNHGIFGDEKSMLGDGMGVESQSANLIAKGEAEPMIIVYCAMYTSKDSDQCQGINATETAKYDAFREDLTECLMPYIEAHYPVKTGRENTAIAGFSMGGRESLYIGMTKPEIFGYIGAACPAPGIVPAQDMMTHPGNMSKDDFYVHGNVKPYVLFIAAGTNDSVVQKFPQEYHQLLTQHNEEHLWLEIPGGDHGGSVVVPMFYNFLRCVFKA